MASWQVGEASRQMGGASRQCQACELNQEEARQENLYSSNQLEKLGSINFQSQYNLM